MMSRAISYSVRLHFWVDIISIIMANLATIIKGVLTLGKVSKATGTRSQPMQHNLGGGRGVGVQPVPQEGLTRISPHLE